MYSMYTKKHYIQSENILYTLRSGNQILKNEVEMAIKEDRKRIAEAEERLVESGVFSIVSSIRYKYKHTIDSREWEELSNLYTKLTRMPSLELLLRYEFYLDYKVSKALLELDNSSPENVMIKAIVSGMISNKYFDFYNEYNDFKINHRAEYDDFHYVRNATSSCEKLEKFCKENPGLLLEEKPKKRSIFKRK